MLSNKELNECAEFANSLRGQYIISQALAVAIKQLKSVPEEHREVSNIADMEYLLDGVFPMFKVQEEASNLVAQGVLEIAKEDG